MKLGSLDQWRSYFVSADSDIFDVIEHAIVVAATDYPKEFKLKRDGIAEKLFSCMLNRCFGCEKVELPPVPNEENDVEKCKRGFVRDGAGKESKVNSGREDNGVKEVNHISNYSFVEAEALTDAIERESETVAEVLRIRDVLRNHKDEPDSELFESLRRLELMQLSVDILKSTEIGKAVNPLRKHGSNKISKLARTLIDGWKQLVDAWVSAATNVAGAEGGTPDSVNPSVVVNAEEDLEKGLPSPPLDEGALFVSAPGTMELSKFFDGMDDDGNIRKSAPSNRNRDNGRKHALDKRNLPEFNATAVTAKDNKSQLMKKDDIAAMRPTKPVAADAGRVRPVGMNTQRKANFMEPKLPLKIENSTVQKRSLIAQQDKSKSSDDSAKLEATKRKLQESYQQAENAKRQRTIQVMDVSDLPKQGAANRNKYFKLGNQNRQWGHQRK